MSNIFMKHFHIHLECCLREKLRLEIVERRSLLKYKYLEDPASLDLIKRISDPEIYIKKIFDDILSFISLIIRVGCLLVILASREWLLTIFIVLISVPLFHLAVKSGRANYKASMETTQISRMYTYLGNILTSREAVNERTLFEYGDSLNARWMQHYEKARKMQVKVRKKWFIKMKSGGVITAFICIIVLFSLLLPVMKGNMSVGFFIALVSVAIDLIQAMSWELTSVVDKLANNKEYLKDLTAFMKMDINSSATNISVGAPEFESIEFKNVFFHYPQRENYILKGLSFKIEKGKHYSFVGTNGCGKTTITKLMLGLYDSFEGDILLNGISIKNYSSNEINAFYSVIFQDFAKYNITLKENIVLGSQYEKHDSNKAIRRIMEIFGILTKDNDRLFVEKNLNRNMGKLEEDGADISGGEWQKISLARMLFQKAPIRIMDEPTASLDPISEYEIFKNFERVSQNHTSIFITHRLASTRFVDKIFVIENGKVAETGNHDELMQRGKTYYKMFELQKGWYK